MKIIRHIPAILCLHTHYLANLINSDNFIIALIFKWGHFSYFNRGDVPRASSVSDVSGITGSLFICTQSVVMVILLYTFTEFNQPRNRIKSQTPLATSSHGCCSELFVLFISVNKISSLFFSGRLTSACFCLSQDYLLINDWTFSLAEMIVPNPLRTCVCWLIFKGSSKDCCIQHQQYSAFDLKLYFYLALFNISRSPCPNRNHEGLFAKASENQSCVLSPPKCIMGDFWFPHKLSEVLTAVNM